MSKRFLLLLVVVLAMLLVTTNMMLLAGLRAQDKALKDIETAAKAQGGYVYFPQYDLSGTPPDTNNDRSPSHN